MGNLSTRNGELFGVGDAAGWSYKETLGVGTSDPVPIYPSGSGSINGTIALDATGGEATIQVTASPDDDVEADTALWFDWDNGTITSATAYDVFTGPISGVRCIVVSGTATFTILI